MLWISQTHSLLDDATVCTGMYPLRQFRFVVVAVVGPVRVFQVSTIVALPRVLVWLLWRSDLPLQLHWCAIKIEEFDLKELKFSPWKSPVPSMIDWHKESSWFLFVTSNPRYRSASSTDEGFSSNDRNSCGLSNAENNSPLPVSSFSVKNAPSTPSPFSLLSSSKNRPRR